MGAKPSKPSPKDRIDNAQRRMAQEMELDLTKWNWAVLGQTKAGKSSIVNAVQGMKDNDPGKIYHLLLDDFKRCFQHIGDLGL